MEGEQTCSNKRWIFQVHDADPVADQLVCATQNNFEQCDDIVASIKR